MKKKCTGVIFFLKNGVFLIKDENMDTSRLNHIAGLIARKRSGGEADRDRTTGFGGVDTSFPDE